MIKILLSKFYLALLAGIIVIAGIVIWNFRNKAEISSGTSGIKGSVLLGPQCPVVRDTEDCPDKPYATTLVIITKDESRRTKEFQSDENGMFNVQVPPGEYIIRSAGTSNTRPSCSSRSNIIVKNNEYTETVVLCDTGIR